jgi:tetratricopeptide (TPR) repeat protein
MKNNNNLISFSLIALFGILISCSSPQSKMRELIKEAEKGLLTDSTFSPDAAEAKKLIGLYDQYAKQFPADTLSAEYLFKAGEISAGINDPMGGIEYYKRLYENYPGFSKAPVALFLQGFIYENQLGMLDEAKTIYQQFLDRYPDHPIATDVSISLENLGKSPEEMMEMFQAQQQAQDSLSNL